MRHQSERFKKIGKHVVCNDVKTRLVYRVKENPIKILSDFFFFCGNRQSTYKIHLEKQRPMNSQDN